MTLLRDDREGNAPLDDLGASPTAAALARAKAGELLGPHDLMAIFKIKSARFYELKQRGEFDRFLVDRPITGRVAYSGVKVHRYVSGEPVYEPTFGRKRGPR